MTRINKNINTIAYLKREIDRLGECNSRTDVLSGRLFLAKEILLFLGCEKLLKKKRKVLVIESYDQGTEEWGISFTDHNPEAEDYFKMTDKQTAFRLKEYLNQQKP